MFKRRFRTAVNSFGSSLQLELTIEGSVTAALDFIRYRSITSTFVPRTENADYSATVPTTSSLTNCTLTTNLDPLLAARFACFTAHVSTSQTVSRPTKRRFCLRSEPSLLGSSSLRVQIDWPYDDRPYIRALGEPTLYSAICNVEIFGHRLSVGRPELTQ